MLDITTILDRQCTRTNVDAQSRKRALEAASEVLAAQHPSLSARSLFDELMNRERLGSTGLGGGVAIPHCRMPCTTIMAAFLKLDAPVDYDAIDGEPVDLLFVLVVPPEETSAHLEVLAMLARLFDDSDNRRALRSQPTDGALYDTLTGLIRAQAA
ncbi:MAG: PTS IIA-like nitrogen regulatory protein PtsN [Pseudomonadales bacterium]